jgi:endoglucanase
VFRMTKIKKTLLVFLFLVGLGFVLAGSGCHSFYSDVAQASLNSGSILVDQFGYRPNDKKIAVIVNPEVQGASVSLNAESFPADLYQVISVEQERPVYSGESTLWQNGAIHQQSGDRAEWFDFSNVRTPGNYIIKNMRTGNLSTEFKIAENVYREVLVAATRMYFYQRSGFPKQEPYADARWTDGAAFLGPGQDTEARFVEDKENVQLERDMRGGWFDAGDTNKYVTFAVTPIHQLLDAYTQNSAIWTDDFNLPESGNGIPDLLDEIRYELDWLKQMQDDDGGVNIKIGTLDFNYAERPSLDRRPRFYGPKCSSSTIATASMFAHAALVFQGIPELQLESENLAKSAADAWQWFNRNPIRTDCDSQEIKAGDADFSVEAQMSISVTAAVYLFALTKDQTYQKYISQFLTETPLFEHMRWSVYEPYVGDALLFYSKATLASKEDQQKILDAFADLLNRRSDIYGEASEFDPFLAYMPDDQYHWGSNQVKTNIGNTNFNVILYDIDQKNHELYLNRAASSIHYIHGVNPLGTAYLTNMNGYGSEKSANEMYHEWFGKGIYSNAITSPSGPASGYVTGGPNKDYTGSAPLQSLPPMKAYLDSNEGWDLNMWEITEPGIYYQSSYIKLLSKFISGS